MSFPQTRIRSRKVCPYVTSGNDEEERTHQIAQSTDQAEPSVGRSRPKAAQRHPGQIPLPQNSQRST